MLDATRHWLRQKAQTELGDAQVELDRTDADLRLWCLRQFDPVWELGFRDPEERISYFSDQRHDARGKVRFLRAVVRELGGKL